MTTILIVEDDRLLNEGLKFMLEKKTIILFRPILFRRRLLEFRIRPSVWSFWTLTSQMGVVLHCARKFGERVPFR